MSSWTLGDVTLKGLGFVSRRIMSSFSLPIQSDPNPAP